MRHGRRRRSRRSTMRICAISSSTCIGCSIRIKIPRDRRDDGTQGVGIFKGARDTGWIRTSVGVLAAHYLRLVWKTSRFVIEPEDFYQRVEPDLPVIVAMWHGQHFMMPFVRRGHRVKVLISRHRDGEINAIAAERLGAPR